MRRVALSIATLAIGGSSQGIILYSTGDPTSHTNPTGTIAETPWKYQAQYAGFLATPIGPHAVMTARHIITGDPNDTTTQAGGSIVLNGITYPIAPNTTVHVPGRDLIIFKVNNDANGKSLPYWAPIYNEATDGTIPNKQIVMIGRGTQRGAEIKVSSPSRPGEGADGLLRGWGWGAGDGVQRWGTNTIVNYVSDTTAHEYFYYTFDGNGLPDEGTISGGDSGGGNFIQTPSGVWKFVGVNTNVANAYRFSASGPTNIGAVFDFRDLYVPDPNFQDPENHPYVLAQSLYGSGSPIPQNGFSENIADVPSSQFTPYVPHNGDVNCDGKVNAMDFNVIASKFGTMSGAVWLDGDMNFDGKVNSSDFSILSANFGYSGVAPTGGLGAGGLANAVPEPASLSAVALGALAVRRRRR